MTQCFLEQQTQNSICFDARNLFRTAKIKIQLYAIFNFWYLSIGDRIRYTNTNSEFDSRTLQFVLVKNKNISEFANC